MKDFKLNSFKNSSISCLILTCFAVDSGVVRWTLTLILVVLHLSARSIVLTRIGITREQANLADEIIVCSSCVLNQVGICVLNNSRALANILIGAVLHFLNQATIKVTFNSAVGKDLLLVSTLNVFSILKISLFAFNFINRAYECTFLLMH
jgi:cytochrome c oxidase subunit IV